VTAYDTIRDTLTRLEQAGVEAPKIQATYHRQTDEQASAIIEALDTAAWVPQAGTAGSGAVWLHTRVSTNLDINVFLTDDRPKPDSPMLARIRQVIEGVRNRG
jgi:hypothetical protein